MQRKLSLSEPREQSLDGVCTWVAITMLAAGVVPVGRERPWESAALFATTTAPAERETESGGNLLCTSTVARAG